MDLVIAIRANVALVAMVGALSAHAEGHHWSYGKHGGPAEWGELDQAFASCQLGKVQSPIDIRGAATKDQLQKLIDAWGTKNDGKHDTCALADFDNDGRLDVYVNGTVTGGVSYRDYLLRNTGKAFEDVTPEITLPKFRPVA